MMAAAVHRPPPSTRVQFSIPNRTVFSWTDCVQVMALSDMDLLPLIKECDCAIAVLKEEIERRQKQGNLQQGLPIISECFRVFKQCAGRPLEPVEIEAQTSLDSTKLILGRLTGRCLPWISSNRLSLGEQASIIRLVLNLATYYPTSNLTPECQPNDREGFSVPHALPDTATRTAALIFFAGNDVPECFLDTRCVLWSEDGEISACTVNSNFIDDGLKCLQQLGLLIKREGEGGAMYSYSYDSMKKKPAKHLPKKDLASLRLEALKHVCYIFPKDGQTEPHKYTQKGYALLPILRRCVPHMWCDYELWRDYALLSAAFETFLSATQFGDLTWKIQAIRVTEELAILMKDSVNLARVAFRHCALRRLHFAGKLTTDSSLLHQFPSPDYIRTYDRRSNAFMGQLVLIVTQTLIDRSATSQDVYTSTQKFQTLPGTISLQESLVKLEAEFLYAKSLRYEGKFTAAVEAFQGLLRHAVDLKSRLTLKIIVQYGELESERGHHSFALQLLKQDEEFVKGIHSLKLGSGRRLSLSLAYAHLMEVLHRIAQNDYGYEVILDRAEDMFQWLGSTYEKMGQVGRTVQQSIFQTRCGLAIIHHIRQNLSLAFDVWEQAKSAAGLCWPEQGYAFMITTYSQSQLAFVLHRSDATQLREQAGQTWNEIKHRRG
ncbi:hypothetical protein FPOA_13419 [Fusarium poae]|uniref:Uncharacterized protein n=1 Tax=Fusarium poae TaxID=36050 RepID=A0A1B8A5S5_FUSPO|nr:hypothetical protein FPOA_13419 [Fusarium poae]